MKKKVKLWERWRWWPIQRSGRCGPIPYYKVVMHSPASYETAPGLLGEGYGFYHLRETTRFEGGRYLFLKAVRNYNSQKMKRGSMTDGVPALIR